MTLLNSSTSRVVMPNRLRSSRSCSPARTGRTAMASHIMAHEVFHSRNIYGEPACCSRYEAPRAPGECLASLTKQESVLKKKGHFRGHNRAASLCIHFPERHSKSNSGDGSVRKLEP